MGGIYSYPNMNSRVNRQSLTQTCADCDSSPILVKAFFGVSGTTQQKTLSIIATTNNSLIRNIAKIFLFVSSLILFLIHAVSKSMSVISNNSVSFIKNTIKYINTSSIINYFISKGAIFVKVLSIVSNMILVNIRKIFINKLIVDNINNYIIKNINKISSIVSQATINLIKRINKYYSIITSSIQSFISNKVFIKILNVVSNISILYIKIINSFKNISLNTSQISIKDVKKINSFSINGLNFRGITNIFKTSSLVGYVSSIKNLSVFKTISTIIVSIGNKFIGFPKTLSNSVNISSIKIQQTIKTISTTIQNNNNIAKIINKIIVFGLNIYIASIIIPIIISQQFYKTLITTVNIGNYVLDRLLTISKLLSNTVVLVNLNIKNIVKNCILSISINSLRIINMFKDFNFTISFDSVIYKDVYKTFEVVIHALSSLFIPIRLLTIKTYYSIRNVVSSALRKKNGNSIILIKTDLTPLTRPNKSWVSRRFTKDTLK
mgnify:CR=1 FL=1